MIGFLLASAPLCTAGIVNPNCACSFGAVDQGAWININVLIVIVAFFIGALIYSLSGILPVFYRERLRGAARYEMVQGLLSMFIIMALVTFAFGACQIGFAMTNYVTGYNDPIQYAEAYMSDILFLKSVNLFSGIYAQSIALVFWGNVIDQVTTVPFTLGNPFFGFDIGISFVHILFGFSGVLTTTFSGLLAITFGMLFVLYAMLPLIATIALPVMVPLSIAMRSIPFAGPRLREASDTFLALAIAFYFIFPLTILYNEMLLTWMYAPCSAEQPACNPNFAFLSTYQLNNLPVLSLFQAGSIGSPLNGPFSAPDLPLTFFSSFYAFGGFGISEGLNVLTNLPGTILQFGIDLAQYLFQAIFLTALDLAITIAFAQSLAHAFGAVSRMMAVGPVWGSQ